MTTHKLYDSLTAANIRIIDLEQAVRDMHKTVHDHVFRSGTPKGFPDGSRTVGPEAFHGINSIVRKILGRHDEALRYFSFPDDPK